MSTAKGNRPYCLRGEQDSGLSIRFQMSAAQGYLRLIVVVSLDLRIGESYLGKLTYTQVGLRRRIHFLDNNHGNQQSSTWGVR